MYFYKEISWIIQEFFLEKQAFHSSSWIIQELKHSIRKGWNIVTWGPPHLKLFPVFFENLSALSVMFKVDKRKGRIIFLNKSNSKHRN
jgi:uncharacterized membrane protein